MRCAVSTTPLLKSSNCSMIERYWTSVLHGGPENVNQLMTQNVSARPNVATNATTWFFVRLEMKSPSATNEPPSSSRPRYTVTIDFHSGFPYTNRMPMSTVVTASIAAYSPIAPRNLPRMISQSVSGDVSNSSIVPDFFSSD